MARLRLLSGCAWLRGRCVMVSARRLAPPTPHDYSSFHNGIVLSQLWKNICFSFERPSSCRSRVGSIPSIISNVCCIRCGVRAPACINATLFSVLKMLCALVLQIKSKRHKKSSKTPKSHRKVRDVLEWLCMR